MKVFSNFPKDKKCPICKTNEDRETVLIPIDGTLNGSIEEAEVFHYDCAIEMFRYNREINTIYRKIM